MELLAALKVDLGITTDAYNERLLMIIASAKQLITREGVTIDESALEDQQIIIMYASWLWRRRDTGEGMPRMLRWALNNRVFGPKMAEV